MPKITARAVQILALLVGLVAGYSLVGCDKYVRPIAHATIDCLAVEIRKDIVEFKDQIDPLLDGQHPDWKLIEARAINAGKTVGGCVLAEAVQRFLAPPAGTAVPPPDDAVAARDVLERFRNKYAGNATFKTASGDL